MNTRVASSIAYRGVTGTYSFNNNDADGAAGVTISTYVAASHTWKPVNLDPHSGNLPWRGPRRRMSSHGDQVEIARMRAKSD